MRKATAVAAVAVLAMSVSDSPSSAAPKRKVSCDRQGSTLAASGRVRAYTIGRPGFRDVYLCWLPTRKRHRIYREETTSRFSELPPSVVVAGRWAAGTNDPCDDAGCTASVSLFDGQTGRIKRFADTVVDARVANLEINRDGEIEWVSVPEPANPSSTAVRILTDQRDEAVTTGSDIDTQNLAMTHEIAYWFQGGTARSATLD